MFRCVPKLALLMMAVIVVQPFCPAVLLSADIATASPPDDSDCHESIPVMPTAPAPAKKCCAASHAQIAIPGLRYASAPPCTVEHHLSQISVWAHAQQAFDSMAVFTPSSCGRSSPILRI